MTQILLDTGPLVAFYDRRDSWHYWVHEQMSTCTPPLFTAEPVLSEACFLLQRSGGSPAIVIKALQQGILSIAINLEAEAAAVKQLMERYANVPMSLADACLVRLSELRADSRVFTLDQHFVRYRRNVRHVVPILAPW